MQKTDAGMQVVVREARTAAEGKPETQVASAGLAHPVVQLRAIVREGARYRFGYSVDGRTFTPLAGEFVARPGRWVGAKIGLFALAPADARQRGSVDVDWFRIGR